MSYEYYQGACCPDSVIKRAYRPGICGCCAPPPVPTKSPFIPPEPTSSPFIEPTAPPVIPTIPTAPPFIPPKPTAPPFIPPKPTAPPYYARANCQMPGCASRC